jgi:tetratricopeptide (TPR) repeat protein
MTQGAESGVIRVEFQQALALHRQGQTDAAGRAYEQVLLAQPAHLDALIHLGALRLGQGRPSEAEALLRRAVAASPGSAEALANLAAALQALGRYDEATARYEEALARRPDMADARFGLAACLQASGRHEAAIDCYRTILLAEPVHPEANYGLATLLAQLGRVDEAKTKYRDALSGDPDFAEASFGLGMLLLRGDTPDEAVACFSAALDVDPNYVEARVALGNTLSQLERDDEAMAAFRTVLVAEPDHAEAHNGIGILLDRRRRHDEAIGHYRAALARRPEYAEALAGMANSMKNAGRYAEALVAARQVVALRPDHAPSIGLLGSILAETGSLDEAVSHYRRAVALAPARTELCYHLVQLAKVRPDDGVLGALEATLSNTEALPRAEQCQLQFALAKAYDDVGDRDRGFSHLMRGNALKRSEIAYDETATLGALHSITRVFSPELLSRRQNLGDPSNLPVFIVGMPRSGTTLVEQTLASHPAVFGAGERPELSQAVAALSAGRLGTTTFPHAVWTMAGGELRGMGTDYLVSLRSLAPDAARITDKMPGNFPFVGLIRLILPNARIIHVRRDPVDTCLSCFSKLFGGEQAFSYDLAELGRYYTAYRCLMAYWHSVLPADVLLEVEYEALVADFEPQARRIVAHCGLDWDPACLEFYKTSRPVHTASMVQVRQPIYRSSIGRWRPDAELLRPLLEALAT